MNYLGLNLNHDSSIALVDHDGTPLAALGEERVTRVKNQFGLPKKSLGVLLSAWPDLDISEIVIGSHSLIETDPHSLANFHRGGGYLLEISSKC